MSGFYSTVCARSNHSNGEPELIAARVCEECAGKQKYSDDLKCRYDCMLGGHESPDRPGFPIECHCDYDDMWNGIKCDSECAGIYNYQFCKCCQICRFTKTQLMGEETREELDIKDEEGEEGRKGDLCDKCDRAVYHNFEGWFETDIVVDKDGFRVPSEKSVERYVNINEICMKKLHKLVEASGCIIEREGHLRQRSSSWWM